MDNLDLNNPDPYKRADPYPVKSSVNMFIKSPKNMFSSQILFYTFPKFYNNLPNNIFPLLSNISNKITGFLIFSLDRNGT